MEANTQNVSAGMTPQSLPTESSPGFQSLVAWMSMTFSQFDVLYCGIRFLTLLSVATLVLPNGLITLLLLTLLIGLILMYALGKCAVANIKVDQRRLEEFRAKYGKPERVENGTQAGNSSGGGGSNDDNDVEVN